MSATALALFRQFLEQQKAAGGTHVSVSQEALQKLSSLKRNQAHRLQDAEQAAIRSQTSPPPDPQALQTAVDRASQPSRQILEVAGDSPEEKLQHLARIAEQSPDARALGTLRDTMVFAVGAAAADLMLVGEAPGFQEERQREPFVGPAGAKLTQILKAMGLTRESVYISNICKFRPAIGDPNQDQGTRNRKPTPVEMRSCLPYVLTEIDVVQPRCLIALGATAAEGLGLEGSVGRLRGTIHQVSGIPTIVTYHPSYVLREEQGGGGMRVKRQVWEDMLQAMDLLGMAISDKQRGYFLPKRG